MYTLDEQTIATLPAEKQELLHFLAEWCDHIEKQSGKNPRWTLYFDEGVFQGQTVCTLSQRDLTPFGVLSVLTSVGWPGFRQIVAECQAPILEVLRRHKNIP